MPREVSLIVGDQQVVLRVYIIFLIVQYVFDFQGTQLYDAKAGGWKDLGMLDVMQVKKKIFFRNGMTMQYLLIYQTIICIRSLEELGDRSLTRVVRELLSHLMTSWLTIFGC